MTPHSFSALLLSGLVALAGSSLHTAAADRPGALRIYWADMEGGAGTLIVTPAGESILIDTGMPGGRDPGRLHKLATEVAGVRRIDHLITTHLHIDHYGGAAELSQLMPIGTVYDNGIPETNPDNNPGDRSWLLKIKPYREFKAEKRVVLQPGDELPLKQVAGAPKTVLRCLAAKQRVFERPDARYAANPVCASATSKEKDSSDNANSIATLLEFGGFQFFSAGDMTWNVEAQLVCPVNRIGVVDVYQVTHHGLDASNNPLVVRSLEPTVTVMSNGTQKGCGAETFATLKSVPSIQAMYQIHRNLRADSANNTLPEQIANLEAQCAAHHIELAVDAAAATYTVGIPGNGHRRTFQVR